MVGDMHVRTHTHTQRYIQCLSTFISTWKIYIFEYRNGRLEQSLPLVIFAPATKLYIQMTSSRTSLLYFRLMLIAFSIRGFQQHWQMMLLCFFWWWLLCGGCDVNGVLFDDILTSPLPSLLLVTEFLHAFHQQIHAKNSN